MIGCAHSNMQNETFAGIVGVYVGAQIPNSWVVQDDIIFSSGNEIPLWMFGFLY